jgi:hypothetical protein
MFFEADAKMYPLAYPLVALVGARCPVAVAIVSQVDRLLLALARNLEQQRGDMTASHHARQLQALVDPHSD